MLANHQFLGLHPSCIPSSARQQSRCTSVPTSPFGTSKLKPSDLYCSGKKTRQTKCSLRCRQTTARNEYKHGLLAQGNIGGCSVHNKLKSTIHGFNCDLLRLFFRRNRNRRETDASGTNSSMSSKSIRGDLEAQLPRSDCRFFSTSM
jgi:hypothetical protein